MKFMKLGSKSDSFKTDGNNVRYVATDLATDVVVNVGDVKFLMHKFPLLSKSAHLQKLVSATDEGNGDEIHIEDMPGGPSAFEICAKFCYGMTVTLNAHNVVAARCAAHYLGMYETVDKGNLVYKIEVFLSSSIFRSWKDSITVLQTVKSLLPLCEELKIIDHGIEAIASIASVDVSMVDWSYTYNRKKLPEEHRNDLIGVTSKLVPKDWWVEDLCELDLGLYKRIITCIKSKGIISSKIIGDSLKAYAWKRLPGFVKDINQQSKVTRYRAILETIVLLLPAERGSVSCSFLLRLLKAAMLLGSGEATNRELVKRTGQQLEGATVNDLLIRAQDGEATVYNVNIIHEILEEFIKQDKNRDALTENGDEIQEVKGPGILSEASKLMVAKLIDSYLAEIAKDYHLPFSSFICLAEMVSGFSRPVHDGLYRAIDTYLKVHPDISKSERKKICKLMDCKKLSAEACTHAVQNERLPMRVVVQVLFFEQARATASSGSSTPDLPKEIKDLSIAPSGGSKSATTRMEEDWDGVATADELRVLKGELAALRLSNEGTNGRKSVSVGGGIGKMKSMLMNKKIFSKVLSGKVRDGENSSDSSDSLGSGNIEEAKSTPLRRGGMGRHSVS
ncbi:hypothetical protein Leryth_014123 [Lithospermum erythrorhizon]|nr:hypothetical protein Leryth_014123 [Lithospermum erythrorhizon]